MNLQYYWWAWPDALPEKVCDKIIDLGLSKSPVRAITGAQGPLRDLEKLPLTKIELKELKENKRDSEVSWFGEEWIYKELHPFVHKANKLGKWNFEWDWTEASQFTIYKEGQYYGWHQDCWDTPYSKSHKHSEQRHKMRKLSSIVLLSNAQDFTGGELEFNFRNKDPDKGKDIITKCDSLIKKGSMVVFPSFVWHRVTPIKKGVRYTLTNWHIGPPWQ